MIRRRKSRRKSNKPRTQPIFYAESRIQQDFIRWCQMMVATSKRPELGMMMSIPNGMFLTPKRKERMIREGMMVGASDLFLPVARGGHHGLFLELKQSEGRVRPDQIWFIDKVKANGYYAKVVWGLADLITTTQSYLDGKLNDNQTNNS